MKHTTKLFLLICATSGTIALANQYHIIVSNEDSNYNITTWHKTESTTSEWEYSEIYGCTNWTPSTMDYNHGIEIDQDRNCFQDQTRIVQEREQHNTTGEYRNVGEAYEEKIVNTIPESQSNTGNYRGAKCLDILNKGEHFGTGNYTLIDNSVVYCEMEVAGGGYQLKRTHEYIPDGNLTDGTGVDLEDGSNPNNEIVSIQNPVSNYAIKQTSLSSDPNYLNTEYEIHPDVCDMVTGDYVALTIWTDSNNYNAFHNRLWDTSNNPYSEGVEKGMLINQVIVNGKTWYQYRHIRPIQGNARNIQPITDIVSQTCFSWYVGYGSSKPVPVHLTGFSLQVYTK